MLPRNRLPNVAPLAAVVLQRIGVVAVGSEQLPSDRAGGLKQLRLVLDVAGGPDPAGCVADVDVVPPRLLRRLTTELVLKTHDPFGQPDKQLNNSCMNVMEGHLD